MHDFILIFLVYAWVLFFDDVYRFFTILTRHSTFNELEIKFPRFPLTYHGRGKREKKQDKEGRAHHGLPVVDL